jgi:hypothetical protein
MTEQQKYKVVKKFVEFEVRDYESCNIAEVSVDGSMSSAGSYGFRPLFNYISQNNISMTAPVIQIPVKNDQWKISFVMPSGSDIASLPISKNSEVEIKKSPKRILCLPQIFWKFLRNKIRKKSEVVKKCDS